MLSTIVIDQLEKLPLNNLVILKDNLGSTDIFSLCLKANNVDIKSLYFKIAFISIDNVPIGILMIKSNDKIYKCLIGFNMPKEFEYLRHLMSLESFNLFLFSDKTEKSIIRIENLDGSKKFSHAMSAVQSNMPDTSIRDVDYAKQEILNTFSDDELWNLSIFE